MKRCPVCESSEIGLYMGGQFGKYECKECNYIGPIILYYDLEDKNGKNKRKEEAENKEEGKEAE